MPFRLSAKNIFLTYPQCPLSPQQLLDRLRAKFTFAEYSIGQENHQDGNLHLHAVLCFEKKLETRTETLFDVDGYHPNIQAARNRGDCIRYTQKEGLFITNITEIDGKKPIFTEVANLIRSGKTYRDLVESHPGFTLQHSKKIKEFIAETAKPEEMCCVLREWQQQVADILRDTPNDRTVYWCWESTGGRGKSFLAEYLVRNAGGILLPSKSAEAKYLFTGQRIAIFDFSRSQEDAIPYGLIEEIKNAHFASTKYEPVSKIYNKPHVICFANFEPDLSKLSIDRWNVINIQ